MPVITGLEVHQRDKARVRLFLDDEYALDLPLIEAARLRRGQTLAAADVAALGEAQARQSACDRAIRFLSYRPRSREEVRRHLAKKQAAELVVASAIEHLEALGYIDDFAFARFWVANRCRFKPLGLRALRYELRQKGVDDGTIDAALAEVDERDMAFRAANARLSRYRGLKPREFAQKLRAMLRRRGFGEYTISDIAQELRAQLEERDPDYFRSQDMD